MTGWIVSGYDGPRTQPLAYLGCTAADRNAGMRGKRRPGARVAVVEQRLRAQTHDQVAVDQIAVVQTTDRRTGRA